MHGFGYDGFHSLWGEGSGMVLAWVSIVVLGIWSLRMLLDHNPSRPPASSTSPVADIVKRRYANGKILRDEYPDTPG